MEVTRDIGESNTYSTKGDIRMPLDSPHRHLIQLTSFCITYVTSFNNTPRHINAHYNLNPALFFVASIYLPFRYRDHINTMSLFQVRDQPGKWRMRVARIKNFFLIYSLSIFAGQLASHYSWSYKKTWKGMKNAIY